MKCLSNTVCSTTDTQEVIFHTYHKGVSRNKVVTELRFFRYVSYSYSGKGIRAVMSWSVQSPLTINPTQETYWKEKPKSVVASLGQEAVKYWAEQRVYRGFLKGLGSSILRWPEIQGIIWPDIVASSGIGENFFFLVEHGLANFPSWGRCVAGKAMTAITKSQCQVGPGHLCGLSGYRVYKGNVCPLRWNWQCISNNANTCKLTLMKFVNVTGVSLGKLPVGETVFLEIFPTHI